jgi:hypothetical protein
MILEFPWQIFEKYRYHIFLKIVQWEPSSVWTDDGQTDRHDKANSRFSRFCERAKKKFLSRTRIRVPDRLACNLASMPNDVPAPASLWLMFLAPLVSQQVYIFFSAQYSFPLRCSLSHCAHFQDAWLLMRSLHTIVVERINWIPCVRETDFHSVGI